VYCASSKVSAEEKNLTMTIIIEITLLDISYIRPEHQLTIEIGIFLGLVSFANTGTFY
jgi:hypothetical protein